MSYDQKDTPDNSAKQYMQHPGNRLKQLPVSCFSKHLSTLVLTHMKSFIYLQNVSSAHWNTSYCDNEVIYFRCNSHMIFIGFKIAVLTYRSLSGSAASYLSSYFTRVVDVPSRHRLRSASSNRLTVPFCRRTTFDKRSLPVAGANIWNELPLDITSVPSLPVFRQRLKTFLFRRSYPDLLI